VTNGVLQNVETLADNKQRFNWLLSVPASDYNIALNIGPYARISQTYQSINGATVPLEFWALKPNEDKAKALIKDDVMGQLEFFERKLGPYPWGDQKLGVVETPHLGMEHQTVNAYGKGYERDKYGFDWLLQHELSHEWFGNLMTHEKLNDAWLHEGFGLYMQPAYALDKLGIAAYHYQMYQAYLGLQNCDPVVRKGVVTSEQAFNPDIYGKGGWTLHTLRNLIGEDKFWQATRELLYGTAETANLQYPITPRYRNTADFVAIVNRISGQNLQWLFDVYLYEAALPELIEVRTADQLQLNWKTPGDKTFPMPVEVAINGKLLTLDFSKGAVTVPLKSTDKVQIDPEMKVLRQLPILGSCEEIRENRKKRQAKPRS
jgi:aminopeptidase N